MSKEKHEIGPMLIRELATILYKSSVSAYKEAVSNALDTMVPFDDKKIALRKNALGDGDIEIKYWGTGIEDYYLFNYNLFKIIAKCEIIANKITNSNTSGTKREILQ